MLANSPKTTKTVKASTPENRETRIYNGTRGTKYYLDSNGEKVYVK
jgi:PBCV-specific basic adaptor domain